MNSWVIPAFAGVTWNNIRILTQSSVGRNVGRACNCPSGITGVRWGYGVARTRGENSLEVAAELLLAAARPVEAVECGLHQRRHDAPHGHLVPADVALSVMFHAQPASGHTTIVPETSVRAWAVHICMWLRVIQNGARWKHPILY